MATETQKKDNLLQLTTMSLLSLTAGVWDTLGETSFALGNNIGTQLLEMMEKDTGLEIAGETPQDVMTEIGRIFVDEFGLAQDIDVAIDNDRFELKVKQCVNFQLSTELLQKAGVEKPFICPVMNACGAALKRMGHRTRPDIKSWPEGRGSIITFSKI